MKVQCSGVVTADGGTKLVNGLNTRFKLELRPGDLIELRHGNDWNNYQIEAVYSDSQLTVTSNVYAIANATVSIIRINPTYLLSAAEPKYMTAGVQFGYPSSEFIGYSSVLYGGQIFEDAITPSMCTLTSDKAVHLPSGYNFFAPYSNLTVATTKAGTTTLTMLESDVRVATSANSTNLTYLGGNVTTLIKGLNVVIDGIKYKIIDFLRTSYTHRYDIWLDTQIVLDKPVPKSFSAVYMYLDPDYSTLFPVGSAILINGKLYTVKSSNSKAIQVRYPISDDATVVIRKPLMGTQYAANTLELFNIPVTEEYLKNGNIVVLQDIHSEDNLYAVNSCYTEIKHIARVFDDGRLVTDELNGTPFTGLVCFGVPNYGLKKSPYKLVCQSTYVSILGDSDLTYTLQGGDYLRINDVLYKVNSQNQETAFMATQVPTGIFDVYFPSKYDMQADFSELVINLAMRLIDSIIKTGVTRTASLNSLRKEFLQTWTYACYILAQQHTIYSLYEPEQFCVTRYSAPQMVFEAEFAVDQVTPSGSLEIEHIVYERCGLPLSSARG